MSCFSCGNTLLQVSVTNRSGWPVLACRCGCWYRLGISSADAAEMLAARELERPE